MREAERVADLVDQRVHAVQALVELEVVGLAQRNPDVAADARRTCALIAGFAVRRRVGR